MALRVDFINLFGMTVYDDVAPKTLGYFDSKSTELTVIHLDAWSAEMDCFHTKQFVELALLGTIKVPEEQAKRVSRGWTTTVNLPTATLYGSRKAPAPLRALPC